MASNPKFSSTILILALVAERAVLPQGAALLRRRQHLQMLNRYQNNASRFERHLAPQNAVET